MDDERRQGNRAYLVRCVADGLYQRDNAGQRGTDDLLALVVAERVVGHLDSLGFVVLRRRPVVSRGA